jgi:hypothetical protein
LDTEPEASDFEELFLDGFLPGPTGKMRHILNIEREGKDQRGERTGG